MKNGKMNNREIQLIKLLRECEDTIDSHNAVYGSREHYCLLCLSNEYNGSEGIIHEEDCLIKRLRKQLNNDYKIKTKTIPLITAYENWESEFDDND